MSSKYRTITLKERMLIVQFFRVNEGRMSKKRMSQIIGCRLGLRPEYLETVHNLRWFKDLMEMWDMNESRRAN